MTGFDDPAFYGDRWAAVYDDHHAQMDPGPAVEFLAGLAGDGRVLELAIGTGRVALPLAARGITVEGVDASAAMVEQLRAKPGGESSRSPWETWPRCRSAAGSGWCTWCSTRSVLMPMTGTVPSSRRSCAGGG